MAYGSDMDQVLSVLEKAGRSVKSRVQDRDPRILLLEFGSSSVDFEVSIWAQEPWAARTTRSTLNMAIWQHLKDAGITIAFPQLDVHFEEVGKKLPSAPGADGRMAPPEPESDFDQT